MVGGSKGDNFSIQRVRRAEVDYCDTEDDPDLETVNKPMFEVNQDNR